MAIIIPKKSKRRPAPQPVVAIDHLAGTARALAALVRDHANYEFEGFRWLQGTFGGIAEHLDRDERTIRRAARRPPFHYITRRTPEDGKHILLKLGTEPCENDHVHRLRAIWVKGIAFYNVAAAKIWPIQIAQLQQQQGYPETAGALAQQQKAEIEKLGAHLLARIEAAKAGAAIADQIKANGTISYTVKPHQMGHLRGIVRALGDDAFAVVNCLTTFEGWRKFAAIAKHLGRTEGRYYHWPELAVINANADLALETYLEMAQAAGKISIPESARLLAKIASLTPALAA